MKKLLTLALVAVFAMPVMAADEAPKTKQICKDTIGKDNKPVKNKDGSVKQTCKTIKIHEKHEGTKVPEKKK
jgi:azurin